MMRVLTGELFRHVMGDMFWKQEQGAVEDMFNKKLQCVEVGPVFLVESRIPTPTEQKELLKSKCICLMEAELDKRNMVTFTNARKQLDKTTAM